MLEERRLVRVLLGDRELGEEVLLLEDEIHLVGDPQGVLHHVGAVGEHRRHLLGALEVEPLVVVHPVRVVPVLPEADTEEDVVGLVVLRLEEVGVVGDDRRETQLVRQLEGPSG